MADSSRMRRLADSSHGIIILRSTHTRQTLPEYEIDLFRMYDNTSAGQNADQYVLGVMGPVRQQGVTCVRLLKGASGPPRCSRRRRPTEEGMQGPQQKSCRIFVRELPYKKQVRRTEVLAAAPVQRRL